MKVWLDDVRPAPEGYVWVKTGLDCIDLLINHWDEIRQVSLDHDLGDDTVTGTTVATFIEMRVIAFQDALSFTVAIHSANPVGRKNMEAALRSAKRADEHNELHDADPNCFGTIIMLDSGVKCSKCKGWFCW